MNLDELQSAQSRERQTDSLQQLRGSFYEEAGRFIQQLREEREHVAEQCDDPFDAPDVQRLSNEIKTAEQTVESIYERRIGKLVKQASLEAADMTANAEGLTTEERETFDKLVSTIEDNREHVLSVLTNDQNEHTETTTESETKAKERTEESEIDTNASREREQQTSSIHSGNETDSNNSTESDSITNSADAVESPNTGAVSQDLSVADMMGDGKTGTQDSDRPGPPETQTVDHDQRDAGDGESSAVPEHDTDRVQVDRAMIKITRDVGKILCVDEREYDLSADDVVELPETNVGPLLANNAAERLD